MDTRYILIQSALIMAVALWPFLIVSMMIGRRIIDSLKIFFIGFAIASISLALAIYLQNVDADLFSAQVGPSWVSIREELLPIFAWTLWLPVGVIGLTFLILKLRSQLGGMFSRPGFPVLTGMASAGWWIIFICVMGEYTREDTIWTEQFSRYGWHRVREGMDKPTVYQLVGEPLTPSPRIRPAAFADGDITPEMWAWSSRAGYYAAIWFTNDLVMTKTLWFAD